MSQYASPNADTQVGDWGTAPLYSQVDETYAPDDSDYISFNGLTGTTPCILALSTITAPDLNRGQVALRVRCRHTGKDGATLTVTFKSSTDTIKTWTISPIGQDFTSYVTSLDGDQLTAVTTWSSMSLTLAYAGTGVCDVSMFVLADEGAQDQMGEPLSESDMKNGGYCSVNRLWYPASQLMWVDGERVHRQTGRTPDKH